MRIAGLLAVALLVAACTSSSTPATRPWRTVSLAGSATVRIPSDWTTAPYRGVPATVYFPLVYASTDPLPAACPRADQACVSQNWFPKAWRVPADGALVLWSEAEVPGGSVTWPVALAGRSTTVGGHVARIRTGSATDGCPAGATREVDLYVQQSAKMGPGYRFDAKACFGPHADGADRQTVQTVLTSLRIKS